MFIQRRGERKPELKPARRVRAESFEPGIPSSPSPSPPPPLVSLGIQISGDKRPGINKRTGDNKRNFSTSSSCSSLVVSANTGSAPRSGRSVREFAESFSTNPKNLPINRPVLVISKEGAKRVAGAQRTQIAIGIPLRCRL